MHLFTMKAVSKWQYIRESLDAYMLSFISSQPRDRIKASMNKSIFASDNGLSPSMRQAIIWSNAGILLIGPLGTKSSEIRIKIQNFSFMKIHLKKSSGKWQPFCAGGDELSFHSLSVIHIHYCNIIRFEITLNNKCIVSILSNFIIKCLTQHNVA